jgi:hypothetical protein
VSRLAARMRAKLTGPGRWRTWLGLTLLVALLCYALFAILWHELPSLNLRELFSRVSLGDVVLALAIYSLDLALAVAGWGIILGMLSGFWRPIDHLRIYTLTVITRRLPGTFWYIVGRVVLYERLGVARSVTALAGGFEFAATVIGGLLVAIVTWPLVLSAQGVSLWWLLLALGLCAALLNPPAVRWAVRRLSPDHHTPAVRYRHLLAWVFLYALVWAFGGVLLHAMVRAIYPLPLEQLPAMIGVWAVHGVMAMLLFSFVPFGLGVTELTLATLLSPFVPAAEAFFVALLMRALLTLFELAYGVLGAALSFSDLSKRPADVEKDISLPDAE